MIICILAKSLAVRDGDKHMVCLLSTVMTTMTEDVIKYNQIEYLMN